MESLTKQEQQSGSGPLNPLTKKLFPPVFVWSNLASVVSQFDPRFPRSLHFRSNVYREAIQNHVIQRILTSPPSTGKHPSQRYRQSQPQPQSQKSSHGLALPSYYLDLFHTSMAFGQLAHQPGDPVHFSPDYRCHPLTLRARDIYPPLFTPHIYPHYSLIYTSLYSLTYAPSIP